MILVLFLILLICRFRLELFELRDLVSKLVLRLVWLCARLRSLELGGCPLWSVWLCCMRWPLQLALTRHLVVLLHYSPKLACQDRHVTVRNLLSFLDLRTAELNHVIAFIIIINGLVLLEELLWLLCVTLVRPIAWTANLIFTHNRWLVLPRLAFLALVTISITLLLLSELLDLFFVVESICDLEGDLFTLLSIVVLLAALLTFNLCLLTILVGLL